MSPPAPPAHSPSGFIVGGSQHPLQGETTVPGDKSIGHRAVMFAAIADGASHITGLSGGEDNLRTIRAFRALGVSIEERTRHDVLVEGRGLAALRAASTPLDCGNSGTTMRLLSGLLAARDFSSVLVGDSYLHARPMGRVARPLSAMGARVEGAVGKKRGEVYPPLEVGGGSARLVGIQLVSEVASAQVKSAVILAALSANGVTSYTEPTRSRDHTERMLSAMGAPIHVEANRVEIDPRRWDGRLAPRDTEVPGDLSSAAFLLGAALLVPGSRVVVRGVGVNPTRTGVLDVLEAMGARITLTALRDVGGEPVADLVAEHSRLHGVDIGGTLSVRAIDELPLLAALAAHAEGRTTIRDAEELRVKESDRIAATAAALRALGASVEERPDGLAIEGRPGGLRGGEVRSEGDHRIAMAGAVCALATEGQTRIHDTENVATSFPTFLASLALLGADIVGVAPGTWTRPPAGRLD